MASWQGQFASSLLRRLGVPDSPGARQALIGWVQAEGGHTNGARHNPLNTTQDMPGAGNTGTQGNIKVYSDWSQGVEATARTLTNGRYGGILHGLKTGDAAAVARAIGASPWGTSGDLVSRTISGASAGAGAQPFMPSRPPSTPGTRPTAIAPAAPAPYDQAGYDLAVRKQRVASLLEHSGHGSSVLFRSGLLSSRPVDPAAFGTSPDPSNLNVSVNPALAPVPAAGGQVGRTRGLTSAVAAARRELGVITENTGHNRGTRLDQLEGTYGMIGQAWCGMFAGMVLKKAGVRGIGPWIASVAEIEARARNGQGPFAGWTSGAHARPGDLVIPVKGQHVAVVERVDSDGTIHVIGGNNSNGTVGRAVYAAGGVHGIARVRAA